MKKNVGVQRLLDYGNFQLKRTDEVATKEYKSGICTMIEKVLRDSESYNGYMHLDGDDCEINTLGYWSREYFCKLPVITLLNRLNNAY